MAKLILNGWEDEHVANLQVALINTALEDYRLAYTLNRYSELKLSAAADLVIKANLTISKHAVFYSQHLSSSLGLFLIGNRSHQSSSSDFGLNLFPNNDPKLNYLIPKFSK